MMEPVHLVLPTRALGGAEKRFLGIFRRLSPELPALHLVAHGALLDLARSVPEIGDLEALAPGRVRTFDGGNRALATALRRVHRSSPGAVFHYVLVPPPFVHWFPSRRVAFTVPLSGLNLYSWRGRLSVYAGALAAARTDFLDAGVCAAVRARLPFLARRFSVTPGSFVDLGLYAPLPAREKRDEVAFVGLFSHEKQAFRLVEQLPEVAARLRTAGTPAAFRLLGRESGATPTLAERVRAIRGEVDVAAGFETDPRPRLAAAKVCLSLQRNTNFPSKALLEGLACGALPVVTDVGDSRRMVPDGVAEWVPRDFGPADLAAAIQRILALSPVEHDARVARVRAHLETHFSFAATADYYRTFWRETELATR